MSQDKYSFFGKSFPAIKFVAITPSDVTELNVPRSIYVGTTGNVAVEDEEGNSVVFNNVPDATILPIQPTKILATNTTAGNIIGLY